MPSAELRLFISSTFQDLQDEREHLVKKIFPEIRTLCRERGITFTEVDLRWGLTHDEGTYGRIIRTCLEEIDRCRPYFIGILGSRYGHVPEYLEIQKDPELLRQHPWVEQAVLDGTSITAMEMRYAVLDDPAAATGARFYVRRERASLGGEQGGGDAQQLEALKDRIRASGAPVHEFRDPASLGELVYDDLIDIIRRDFADVTPPTPLEQERTRHAAFSASRRHAYIPNPKYLKRLNDWHTSDEPPVVVYAESGSGKSSLAAFWCEQLRRREPGTLIVEHYVGIGAGDTDHLGLIRHVAAEIKERFAREEDLPSTPEQIEGALGQWLGYAAHELKQRGERMVLMLDGLNQLTGRSLNLLWMPDVMAPEIRFVVTTTVEETLVKLRKRGWGELGMQPLGEPEREAVVVRFLSEYHKSLPADLVRQIAADPKCAHPLFLRTLLEELRVYGHHDRIASHIERLLESTGTEDLFQRVLERMEDDYSLRTVREVMSLVCASREGLSEEELAELTGISRLKLSTMLLGLDYHLVRHEGLVTFFHDYLRRAVLKRYLSDESSRRESHRALARYFEHAELTLRSTRELLHALEGLGDLERLHSALAEIARFELLWNADRHEVLVAWAGCDSTTVVEAYRRSLEEWERRESPAPLRRAEILMLVGDLHNARDSWQESERLQLERLTLLRALGDRSGESNALSRLSSLAHHLGRNDEAERHAREAEAIAHASGDTRGIALSVGIRGGVHYQRGEYAEALACFREQEALARELGDRRSIGVAVAHRGIVLSNQGELDEALECYRELEAISRELGNRHNVARAVGNRGIVHGTRGEYAQALVCFREEEAIARELGDRSGFATAVGNRGIVHSELREHAESLACYHEQETISRELGDRRGIAAALGNRGVVHSDRGEYAEAMECYREKEAISRELGYREGIAIALSNQGHVHCLRGEHTEALECSRTAEAIADELGSRVLAAQSVGGRASAHRGLEEYSEALECLRTAATEHRRLGYRKGLARWLLETAQLLIDLAEADGAMPEYLPATVVGADSGQWRALALGHARALAEESQAISRELSMHDTLFEGRIALARIDAAEGRVDAAVVTLRTILEGAVDDKERAECHYRLWKLGADDSDHRAAALRLYRPLLETIPRQEYRRRIDELTAPSVNANSPYLIYR